MDHITDHMVYNTNMMNCTIKPKTITLLHGRPGEYTKDVLELTWYAPGRTITTTHDTFEEVKEQMQYHINAKEIYEQEQEAIAEWYENNRKNGSNWTGD